MSKLGLIININGFSKKFFNFEKTFICNDLEHAHKILLNYLSSNLNILNIDYPLNLNELDYYWFDGNHVDANIFSYKIFDNNQWIEPWDKDDIYSELLDIMNKQEIENAPDFSKVFLENNDDNDDNDNDNNYDKPKENDDKPEKNDDKLNFEEMIKEIISKS